MFKIALSSYNLYDNKLFYNAVYKMFYNAAYNNHDVKGLAISLHSGLHTDKVKEIVIWNQRGKKKIHEDRSPAVNVLYTCSILGTQITNTKVLHLPQIRNIIPEKLQVL